jgi:putative flippase GtrA
VGAFNTGLDLALFTLGVAVFHLVPLVANAISTTITMCVSYLLNRTFVFRSEQKHAKALIPFFTVTLTSGLLIQGAVITIILALTKSVTLVPYEVLAAGAKICAIGVGLIANYLGYRFIFTQWNKPISDTEESSH